MFIIMDLDQIVQQYLSLYESGNRVIERPACCSRCSQSKKKLHRHGLYKRNFITLAMHYLIPIFRFLCPDCAKTTNVIQDFVEKYHQVALDVKEQVMTNHEKGDSYETIEKTTDKIPSGPYSNTTIRRWIIRWKERLEKVQPVFWEWIFMRTPHVRLPLGEANTRIPWDNYLIIWQQVRMLPAWKEISFLHGILRFSLSLTVSLDNENPTKDVRRNAIEFSRKWEQGYP